MLCVAETLPAALAGVFHEGHGSHEELCRLVAGPFPRGTRMASDGHIISFAMFYIEFP